ncbi:hypothetical protein FIBSPDRAFT_926985, partial [Athelia psychrophila]
MRGSPSPSFPGTLDAQAATEGRVLLPSTPSWAVEYLHDGISSPSVCTGAAVEMITLGGEAAFVVRMVRESLAQVSPCRRNAISTRPWQDILPHRNRWPLTTRSIITITEF